MRTGGAEFSGAQGKRRSPEFKVGCDILHHLRVGGSRWAGVVRARSAKYPPAETTWRRWNVRFAQS